MESLATGVKHKLGLAGKMSHPSVHVFFTVHSCAVNSTTKVTPEVKSNSENLCNKETKQEIQERKWEKFPV